MIKRLYIAGLGYAAICAYVILTKPTPRLTVAPAASAAPGQKPPHAVAPPRTTSGFEWFQQTKPFCNMVEVENRLRQAPAPSTRDGQGFRAACLAIAGKIDSARAVIQALNPGDRGTAASVVFEVGHPVADAGDDRAAGPMMELVLDFWPQNYMAQYHAGMSEYALGQPEIAQAHLHRFLDLYQAHDGWRSNAMTVLARIEHR